MVKTRRKCSVRDSEVYENRRNISADQENVDQIRQISFFKISVGVVKFILLLLNSWVEL